MVTGDKGPVLASEGIDISHHAGGPVHNVKEATQKFLCPAAHLMDRPVILKNLFHATAVTWPVKFGTPQVLSMYQHGGLPDKRMVMLFLVGSLA